MMSDHIGQFFDKERICVQRGRTFETNPTLFGGGLGFDINIIQDFNMIAYKTNGDTDYIMYPFGGQFRNILFQLRS